MNSPIGVVSSTADNFERCVKSILEAIETSSTLDEVRSDRRFQRSVYIIRENSRLISEASLRIATIVNGLKAFSAEESSQESASIADCVESTLALIQHQLREGITVVKKLGAVPVVPLGRAELNQVFMALFTNAIRAIPGEGKITIETEGDKDWARIRICDSGVGIPKERLKTLFDLGFTTQGTRIGFEMGLASAYNVVRKNGGNVSVASILGQGSVFTVTLPLRVGAATV